MKLPKPKPWVIKTAITLIIAFIVLFLSFKRTFDVYELHLLDIRYKLRPAQQTDDKIVFVEISDDSIEKIGSWPFDRTYHALLVKALSHAGVRMIIFDMFFSEEKQGDKEFAEAIKEAGNVYIPEVFSARIGQELDFPLADEYEAELIDVFEDVAYGVGHINIIPDIDGKFRRIPPYIRFKGNLYPQMGFLAALDYVGIPRDSVQIVPGRYLRIDEKTRIPLDNYSNIIINFPGKWVDTYRHYSYIDVLTSFVALIEGGEGVVDLDEFKDAICLIGITATAAPDAHPSPFESLYPGVGVHASLINSIIYKRFISRVGKWENIAILILLALVTYLSSIKSTKGLSLVYMFVIMGSFFVLSIILFIVGGFWIDVFYPICVMTALHIGLTFGKYITEMHKREVIEKELSIAKNIQQSFLPKANPRAKGIELEAKMLTAKQVGGDLYDFVDFSETKAGIMIGDVAGKGVPAALYMAKVVSEFKTYAPEAAASKTITLLNSRLSAETGSNLFVTVAYMILDMETMMAHFSLGGHLPILMMREGEEEPRLLDVKQGMPLGILESDFDEGSVDVKKGDIFILYTDGVTEAMNAKHEMFEEERLVEIAKRVRKKSVKEIVDTIHDEVDKYEGKGIQHDDITVIAIRIV